MSRGRKKRNTPGREKGKLFLNRGTPTRAPSDRTTAHDRVASTPGIAGSSRGTPRSAADSAGRFPFAWPHCGSHWGSDCAANVPRRIAICFPVADPSEKSLGGQQLSKKATIQIYKKSPIIQKILQTIFINLKFKLKMVYKIRLKIDESDTSCLVSPPHGLTGFD